jgi:chromosome partitioning protein
MFKPQIVAFVNQKGGVGKTTLASNVAAAADLDGRRTLLLDLDPQGSALDWFAARGDSSRLGVVVAKVDVVLTRRAIDSLTAGYDFVVLDAPPQLGDLTRSAAVAADLIVLPLQASPLDLWASAATLQTLDEAAAIRDQLGLPPALRRSVLNRTQRGTVIARSAQQAAADVAELVDVMIHQRVVYAEAMANGESVLTTEPNGPAADEVNALYAALEKCLRPIRAAA